MYEDDRLTAQEMVDLMVKELKPVRLTLTPDGEIGTQEKRKACAECATANSVCRALGVLELTPTPLKRKDETVIGIIKRETECVIDYLGGMRDTGECCAPSSPREVADCLESNYLDALRTLCPECAECKACLFGALYLCGLIGCR